MSMQELPTELITKIMASLTPEELWGNAQTDKKFNSLAHDNGLWQHKLAEHFPAYFKHLFTLYQTLVGDERIDYWYTKFKQVYQREYQGLSFRVRQILAYFKQSDLAAAEAMQVTFDDLVAGDASHNIKQWLLTTEPTKYRLILDYCFKSAKNFCDEYIEKSVIKLLLNWQIICHQPIRKFQKILNRTPKIISLKKLNLIFDELFVEACYAGSVDKVECLLNYSADINAKTTIQQNTGLIVAVRRQDQAMVEFLLEPARKVNIDQSDVNGMTALHTAVNINHTNLSIIQLLLQAGANPNLANHSNRYFTPMHSLAMNGNLPVLKLLIETYQGNPHLTDKNGLNTVLIAALAGHTATVKYLLAQGVDGKLPPDIDRKKFFAKVPNHEIKRLLAQQHLQTYINHRAADLRQYQSRWGQFFGYSRTEKLNAAYALQTKLKQTDNSIANNDWESHKSLFQGNLKHYRQEVETMCPRLFTR